MKVKATQSFSGDITMTCGEIREISADRAKRLIRAGRCVEVKENKAVKTNENKNSKRPPNN